MQRAALMNCLAPSGWAPQVSGASSLNHHPQIQVTTQSWEASGILVGLEQPVGIDKRVAVSFDLTEDLGPRGSISIAARVIDFPPGVPGSAYPALLSIQDPSGKEWVNLALNGTNGDCAAAGIFRCATGPCNPNPNCTVSAPSAFVDRRHWEAHQFPGLGTGTTNVFPNATFHSSFVTAAQELPRGSYTAKFALVANQYSTIPGYTARVRVDISFKQDETGNRQLASSDNGALDLNFILVGSENVRAAASVRGRMNLNALAEHIGRDLGQSSTSVKLGSVRAFDWICANSGEAYAYADLEEMTPLVEQGSRMVATFTSGGINIFLVSNITRPGITVLGLSGGIGGPITQGLGTSGVAVVTYGMLERYNPSCTGTFCSINQQEKSFIDMGMAASHEVGHYLGLWHPSEADGGSHDYLADTPECETTGSMLSHASCRAGPGSTACTQACPNYNGFSIFCPQVGECQYNHLMWYSTRNYNTSLNRGDGRLFSTLSSLGMNYHPAVQ